MTSPPRPPAAPAAAPASFAPDPLSAVAPAAAAPPDAAAHAEAPPAEPVTLLVCTTCRRADGEATVPTPGEELLAAAEAAADPAVRVEGVVCLANCERRLSAAVVAPGGWTYVFGRLAVADAADLVLGAKMLAEAGGAALPWRGRPDCLKRGLVARIPPLAQKAAS